MKWSQLFTPTLKEVPKDAAIQSHILMLRAGFILKQGSGVYGYLPLGLRTLNKVQKIIQEEIEAIGGQQVFLPHLVSKELWDLTGRYTKMGKGIFTLQDRHHNEFLLGPTHEESMVDMLKGFVKSYKQLPLNFFQITKKFRDEIRPRYGVMRGREFLMMDGYTFHTSLTSLDESYQQYKKAYRRIFVRIGLDTIPVSADSGDMGGEGSEEFMVPSHIGDDTIFACPTCSYVANQEKALFISPAFQYISNGTIGTVQTPNIKTIEDLSEYCHLPKQKIAKTMVFKTQNHGWVIAIVRGDREVNEVKLQNLLKGDKFLEYTYEEIEKAIGPVGFLGPQNLNKTKEMTIILDSLLENQKDMLVGLNQKDVHYQGYSFEGFNYDILADISLAQDKDICPECKKGLLKSFAGIEVGHIFKLGDDYTKKMGLQVLDHSGKTMYPTMGCYGIGVDRSLASVIEQNNDEQGMILPLSIAPFSILITPIGEDHQALGHQIYKDLSQDYEVLLDDRDISAGIKFKDADLVGIPIRITIGKKYKEDNKIGLKFRHQAEEKFIGLEEIKDYIVDYFLEYQTSQDLKLKQIEE